MKQHVFELTETIRDFAFPTKLLKERSDLIELCLRTCRELNCLTPLSTTTINVNTVVLVVNKMSRLFFFTKNKYISIAIPLTYTMSADKTPIFKKEYLDIDSEMWSWLIKRFTTDKDILDTVDYIDFSCRCEEKGISFDEIFNAFLNTDYGYLRYDVDEKAFKEAKDKGKPHHHPMHHCDIHLCNYATFKIGLLTNINPADFIELVDNIQDRWYTVSPKKLIKRKVI